MESLDTISVKKDFPEFCGGVFEQLACYTMRYQESDLHLGLYYSLTSANNLNIPTLLTLFYFSTLL